MKERVWKITICILLIVSVLSLSVSVCATDPTPNPDEYWSQVELNNSIMAYYVYLVMQAWGIDVTYEDVTGFNDNVNQTIQDWIIQFLDSQPSTYSVAQWILPWSVAMDQWGNYKFNSSLLEDVQDFVDWLCIELGIVSNSSYTINPNYALGGINLYRFGQWYECQDINGNQQYMLMDIRPTANQSYTINDCYYFVWHWSDNDICCVAVSEIYGTYQGNCYLKNPNESEVAGGNMVNAITLENHTYDPYTSRTIYFDNIYMGGYGVYNIPYAMNWNNYFPVQAHMFDGDLTELLMFLKTAEITQEGDTKVITGNIVLPDDDLGYTAGDSITIVDGQPYYSVIEWDSTVTVSNLPAVISTGNIPTPGDSLNPGMVEAWRPISSLITTAGEGMAVLLGIVYEFPEEVMIPIFAVMGGIIIFGIIHAMKEH